MTNPQTQDDDREEGTIAVAIKNEVNGRSVEIRVNPDWTMERVRTRAYKRTKDEARGNDRFTCEDENKVINGAHLAESFGQITAPGGHCANERKFYIRGPVGGA